MGTTRKLAIKAYHDAHPQPKKETKPAQQSAGSFLGTAVAYVTGALGFSGAAAQSIPECNKTQVIFSRHLIDVACGDNGNEEEGHPTRMYFTKGARVGNNLEYPTCAQIACDHNDSALAANATLGKFRSTVLGFTERSAEIKNDGRCCVGQNVNGDPMTTQPIWQGKSSVPVRDDNRTQIVATAGPIPNHWTSDGCQIQGRLGLPAFSSGNDIKLLEADPIECFAGNENVTIAQQIWDDYGLTHANFSKVLPKPTPTPTPINRTSPGSSGFATTVMAGVSTAAMSVAQTVSAFVSPAPTQIIYESSPQLDITPIAIAAGVAGAGIVIVAAGVAGLKLVNYLSPPAKVMPPVPVTVIMNPAYVPPVADEVLSSATPDSGEISVEVVKC